jgi:hypothetical protein
MRPTIASIAANATGPEGRDGHREGRESADRRDETRCVREEATGCGATRPGAEQGLTLEAAARDYVWLYDYRHGVGHRKIATHAGVSIRQVREGIERARAIERDCLKESPIESLKAGRAGDIGFRLIPLFPIGALTPQTPCPHHHSIERGSTLCCMVCHASGMDDHPGLRRDPQADPSPEAGPAPAHDVTEPGQPDRLQETRRQRRRRLFAEAYAVA